uniref:K Homology domain-containing protein n=1 Tax=Glossina brevipalpis TaxID=37001 RepID=A0A1A9WNX9_9MUSC
MSDWEDNNTSDYNEKPRFGSNMNNSRRHSNSNRSRGMNRRSDDNRYRERENYSNKNNGRDGAFGRNFPFKASLDLRTECIGRIIGRAGSNIQGLQTEFNVRIDLDKSNGTVTVQGNDNNNVNDAIERIKQQMDECNDGPRQYNGGGSGGGGGGGGDLAPSTNITVEPASRSNTTASATLPAAAPINATSESINKYSPL